MEQTKYLDECPITGLPFFTEMYHPELGKVPTYGGPFDSYTIPIWDEEDETFTRERYDHDEGAWVGQETVYQENYIEHLKTKVQSLQSEISELKKMVTWIPVSERLPEEMGWYLVRHTNGRYSDSKWFGRSWAFDGGVITHWLPIPEFKNK